MNDIVKNTELFINILGMSRTSAVQKWDHEAFQRAFRWAHYFEQVYKKTKSKPQVLERISKHLDEASTQVDSKLGLVPLTYSDLPNSTMILRENLLINPYLSNEFYLQLVAQLNKQPDEKENFKNQLHSLSKLKATLQILQLVQKRFENVATNNTGGKDIVATDGELDEKVKEKNFTKGQITANAVLLRKCLLNVIAHTPSLCNRKKTQLHEKLEHMVKHERGIDVLLLALICDDDKDMSVTNYLIDFLEDILIPRWREGWKSFLQLPVSQLLSKCSCMYERFLEIYFEQLKYCGEKLQEDIEKHDYVLLMEKSQCPPNEQMCKYYYFLLQNLLQTLSQSTPAMEMKGEAFIRQQCDDDVLINISADTNVWKKLSHDMMVSSAI